jgi:hypothetical protein
VKGAREWCGYRLRNASIIVDEGLKKGVPLRGLEIAVMTAMQESQLLNLASEGVRESLSYPHDAVDKTPDHDSVGLFQQRHSQGWGGGKVKNLMDPRLSSQYFYDKLLDVVGNWKGWTDPRKVRATEVAQRVQNSAYPEAYQKHEADSIAVVKYVLGFPK